jgi:hypothetical protein
MSKQITKQIEYMKVVLACARKIGKFRRFIGNNGVFDRQRDAWVELGKCIGDDLFKNTISVSVMEPKIISYNNYPTFIEKILDTPELHQMYSDLLITENQKEMLTKIRQTELDYHLKVKQVKKVIEKARSGGDFVIYGSLAMLPIGFEGETCDMECIIVHHTGDYYGVLDTLMCRYNVETEQVLTRYQCGLCNVRYPAKLVSLHH